MKETIAMLMLLLSVCVIAYKGRFSDPHQQAQWYGYIWDLPYNCYYKSYADACLEYREPWRHRGPGTSPWYKEPTKSYSVKYGPVNVFRNGEWRQEWRWITVPESKR